MGICTACKILWCTWNLIIILINLRCLWTMQDFRSFIKWLDKCIKMIWWVHGVWIYFSYFSFSWIYFYHLQTTSGEATRENLWNVKRMCFVSFLGSWACRISLGSTCKRWKKATGQFGCKRLFWLQYKRWYFKNSNLVLDICCKVHMIMLVVV